MLIFRSQDQSLQALWNRQRHTPRLGLFLFEVKEDKTLEEGNELSPRNRVLTNMGEKYEV